MKSGYDITVELGRREAVVGEICIISTVSVASVESPAFCTDKNNKELVFAIMYFRASKMTRFRTVLIGCFLGMPS